MSNNKDFKVKNGVVAKGYTETVGSVVDNGTLGYALAAATYDNVSFSVASEETTPTGLFFKSDGTKLYVCGQTGDDVNEYNLSTAWDLSTATYNQNFSVSAQESSPAGIFFKADGTKMYIVGLLGGDILEYTLSTAWDVSTASYTQNFSVSAQEVNPSGIYFKPDGTKMYHTGDNSDTVHEYNLSTSWDVSSASFSQSFSVSTQEGNPKGVFFKSDGTKMYICGYNSDSVHEYNLSTAWDITTATYSVGFSVTAQENTPRDVFFKSDGTKMYILGNQRDKAHQYSTVISDKTLDLSTGTVFDVSITDPIKINLTNAPAGSSKTFSTLFLTQEGIGGFNLDDTNPQVGEVFINPVGTNYVYRGLTFKSDGTKMYVSAYNSTFIWQYSLSSPWNVASATYESASPSGLSGVAGITFSADGTKVYGVDYSPDMIYEYDLSTAWDISTLVYNNVTFEPGGSPWHITFKPDGTKMYVTDASVVKQYTLSTAWDLSTASYDSKSLSVSSIYSCYLNADGTKIFVMNTSSVVSEYALSTAYDVSTASFVTSATFFTSSGYSSAFSLFFKPDGSNSYAIMAQDYVVQYANKETSPVLFDDSITLASADTPSIFSTDIIGFETTDAGSTFTGTKFIKGLK